MTNAGRSYARPINSSISATDELPSWKTRSRDSYVSLGEIPNSESIMRQNTVLFYAIVATLFLTCVAFLSIAISRNLQMASVALSDSQSTMHKLNRLEMLKDVIPGGVLIVDTDGITVDANGGFSEMSGYKRRDIIGSHFTRFMPKEFREAHIRRWADPNMQDKFGGETLCLPQGQLLHADGTISTRTILICRTRINTIYEWMVFFDPRVTT